MFSGAVTHIHARGSVATLSCNTTHNLYKHSTPTEDDWKYICTALATSFPSFFPTATHFLGHIRLFFVGHCVPRMACLPEPTLHVSPLDSFVANAHSMPRSMSTNAGMVYHASPQRSEMDFLSDLDILPYPSQCTKYFQDIFSALEYQKHFGNSNNFSTTSKIECFEAREGSGGRCSHGARWQEMLLTS